MRKTWRRRSGCRWADIDLNGVHHPKAYLLTVATREALNRARTDQRRREDYVGPWLPEPWSMRPADAVSERRADPEAAVEVAESVSMAMLVVLASLTPLERAVTAAIDSTLAVLPAQGSGTENAVGRSVMRAATGLSSGEPAVGADVHPWTPCVE